MRAEEDADQSPILGIPFLSQVYLYADYQEKTLSTGLANNTLKYPTTPDQLQCIEHANSTNDLGWAIGSSDDLAKATISATTSSTTSSSAPRKTGATSRMGSGVSSIGMFVIVLGFYLA
jgi:hypothetical protein